MPCVLRQVPPALSPLLHMQHQSELLYVQHSTPRAAKLFHMQQVISPTHSSPAPPLHGRAHVREHVHVHGDKRGSKGDCTQDSLREQGQLCVPLLRFVVCRHLCVVVESGLLLGLHCGDALHKVLVADLGAVTAQRQHTRLHAHGLGVCVWRVGWVGVGRWAREGSVCIVWLLRRCGIVVCVCVSLHWRRVERRVTRTCRMCTASSQQPAS